MRPPQFAMAIALGFGATAIAAFPRNECEGSRIVSVNIVSPRFRNGISSQWYGQLRQNAPATQASANPMPSSITPTRG
jgi:hypothetical protein